MGATHEERRFLADSRFGSGSPASWYVGIALDTAVPADDGTGFVEPVGLAYARPLVTNNTTNWPNATTVDGKTIKMNGTTITWANPSGLWGRAPYIGFFTTLTGGLPRYWYPLEDALTLRSTTTPVEIPAGAFAFEIKG